MKSKSIVPMDSLSNTYFSYYPYGVTIVARRRTYWILFLASCACLAFFPLLFLRLLKGGKSPVFLLRAKAFGSFHFGSIVFLSHYLAAIGIGLCALYSALALGFILYSFRKTVSPEIYFFSFWVLSVGLEVLRLSVFDLALGESAAYWQIAATKALLFARYVGYISLFASGLYAAGFRNEKLGASAAVVIAISFGLATATPVDTGVFATTLELKAGYSGISSILILVLAIVTVADYLYAAHSTGEGSYRIVALGVIVLLVGYRLLTTEWNPFGMVAGFALLFAGSWLFVSRLHAYYLWQ